MMADAGGWLWLVIDVILVAGIGIAYGILAWRKRRKDPAMESARDAATHRAYEENDANKP